jgi:hypothetical protein
MTGREESERTLHVDGKAAALHGAPARAVEFLDDQGVRWRVTERDSEHDPGARAGHCLIFVCDEAVRRVWAYPTGWRDLSAAALTALSWTR